MRREVSLCWVSGRQHRGLSPTPGKDYTSHSALTKFLATPDYGINRAIVFSNERKVYKKNGVTYLTIYYCMFLNNDRRTRPQILPEPNPIQ